MSKYLINREDIGSRIVGYILYDSQTNDFTGYTSSNIKQLITEGSKVFGLAISDTGDIILDSSFGTNNIMAKSGINTFSPINGSNSIINQFYFVVGIDETGKQYEVVTSKYGRFYITYDRLKLLFEFGAIQGGVYLDKNKNIILYNCENIPENTCN